MHSNCAVQGVSRTQATSHQSATPMQTVAVSTFRNIHSTFVEHVCPRVKWNTSPANAAWLFKLKSYELSFMHFPLAVLGWSSLYFFWNSYSNQYYWSNSEPFNILCKRKQMLLFFLPFLGANAWKIQSVWMRAWWCLGLLHWNPEFCPLWQEGPQRSWLSLLT